MIHLIFVTKYRNKDRNNLKLHRKIAPKWGRSFLIKSVKLDPFAECDAILKILIYLALQFQSTPSLRKVTARIAAIRTAQTFQSTPSLRKVTVIDLESKVLSLVFQSTPSLRKVTCILFWTKRLYHNFNPHLPYGRWRGLRKDTMTQDLFQSTPSLRKVTTNWTKIATVDLISIHTFLTEGDSCSQVKMWHGSHFNPHLPYGRWRSRLLSVSYSSAYFNPHLPYGRWPALSKSIRCSAEFQSTPSLRKVTLLLTC